MGLGNLDDLRVVAGGLHLRVARNELVVTLLLRLQLVVERGVVALERLVARGVFLLRQLGDGFGGADAVGHRGDVPGEQLGATGAGGRNGRAARAGSFLLGHGAVAVDGRPFGLNAGDDAPIMIAISPADGCSTCSIRLL